MVVETGLLRGWKSGVIEVRASTCCGVKASSHNLTLRIMMLSTRMKWHFDFISADVLLPRNDILL